MSTTNFIPKTCAALVLAAIMYFLLVAMHARPVQDDLGDNIDWDIIMLQVVPTFAVWTNVLVGVIRSARARTYFWLVVVIVLSPLSFWYTLFVDKGLGPNNSFKPNPHRGGA